jgi:septum formation protein
VGQLGLRGNSRPRLFAERSSAPDLVPSFEGVHLLGVPYGLNEDDGASAPVKSAFRYNPPMLILASASPRRQELLRSAGIEFVVQPANVVEDVVPGESPEACAQRLATAKARAVFNQHATNQVLGADTIVVIGTEILGKPADAEDAARMLRLLSGREHRVITGVCLLTPGQPPREDVRYEITRVTMTILTDQEIADYIAHGEPMDKAGAYAIQGLASRWIPRIEGCYFNVVGLPIPLVYSMLRVGRTAA